MRMLLSTYGSRGNGEPMVGLRVQPQARGADLPQRAAEGWDAPVATGATPTGGWR